MNPTDTINPDTGEVVTRSIVNVARKINRAMADMQGSAPKDGTNQHFNYQYTSVNQYMNHVRDALVRHGLIIIPRLLGKTESIDEGIVDVMMEYTIIDSESGEFLITQFEGRGQDFTTRAAKRGDKGVFKAYSGAMKYFLSETFIIPSGDEPDEAASEQARPAARPRSNPNRPATPPPPPANGHSGQPLDWSGFVRMMKPLCPNLAGNRSDADFGGLISKIYREKFNTSKWNPEHAVEAKAHLLKLEAEAKQAPDNQARDPENVPADTAG